jgi:hypothetical protein
MSRFKVLLLVLAKDRLGYKELEALGVDCANELSDVDKRIAVTRERLAASEVISGYQKKKRWPANDFSAAQKKEIRELGAGDVDMIAERVVAG